MKNFLMLVVIVLSLGLAAQDTEARSRFGGGSSLGKQRAAPAQREAVKNPAAAPAPANTAPAAAPQGFMGKWGGVLAGLGIGALLGSLFSGNLGGMGMLLALLLAGLVVFAVIRVFAARRAPVREPMRFAGASPEAATPAQGPAAFEGIGSRLAGSAEQQPAGVATGGNAPAPEPIAIPGFDKEPFLRVAKTAFIRLQAANDAKDLDDIRDYTTPEMFAELSMIINERGEAPQKTEVVSVEAQLVEAVVEGGWEIASVRFYGLIREAGDANPEPFDETWHVRKKAGDRKATWLIAGIQQNG